MRHSELRHFFLGLAAIATPVSLPLVGCGGAVAESANHGAGGQPAATGGGPVYVGAAPNGGATIYVGTGGVPMYVGSAGAPPMPGTGGALIYTGTGGSSSGRRGSGSLDGGDLDVAPPPPPDAADSGCDDGGDGRPGPSGCGRRPPGLEDAPPGIGADLRGYFQEMARLEAASVPAFRRLGRELGLYGAPRSLLDAARRAARDEVNHTRLGRALAERFGGAYVPPRIVPWRLRSLEALAVDNATEGGVRETFGAMVATWQARAAADPVVRRVMRRVSVDETRHAALALRVAAWTHRRLSPDARARVRDARRRAAAEVLRELDWQPSPELVALAGVPRRDDAKRLARAMMDRLWS